MKRGKEVECSGIESENGEETGQIGEEGYTYMSENMSEIYIRKNNRKEYFKRLRATLK